MQITPDDFQRAQFLQRLIAAVAIWTERKAAHDAALAAFAEAERELLDVGRQLAELTGRPVIAPSVAVAPHAPIAGVPTAVTMPVVAPPPSNEKPADEVVLDWMRGNPQEVAP
jgi:hypothetical protein